MSLWVMIRLAVSTAGAAAANAVIRRLAAVGVINMGAYHTFYAVDLAQNAEAEFTITCNQPMAISQVIVQAALYGAVVNDGLGIKARVGDKECIPSGMAVTGSGVQTDQEYIPLHVFNDAATVGQMLLLMTPGTGNNLSQATFTLKNFGAAAVNDSTVTVICARVVPQP